MVIGNQSLLNPSLKCANILDQQSLLPPTLPLLTTNKPNRPIKLGKHPYREKSRTHYGIKRNVKTFTFLAKTEID